MQVRIDDIVIKQRIRQDLGDLNLLMESMRQFGLLNPIAITTNKELVAGHRRLEAGKRLGWVSIDTVVVETLDEVERLRIEIDENVQRKALSPDELADGFERLKKLQTPRFFTRFRRAIRAFFRRFFGKRKQDET